MQRTINDWTVLIVDDEPFFIELLNNTLKSHGIQTLIARNGVEAWETLSVKGNKINAVLLDRLMPDMDGLEVLKKIKNHPELKHLPVIFQTVLQSSQDILEGIDNGAYYYLTKPYDLPVLVAIVKTACEDISPYLEIKEEINENREFLSSIINAEIEFRTVSEVDSISSQLAKVANDAPNIAIGLKELMLNAVEHGNLGISYKEKTEYVINGIWHREVERRLLLENNLNKVATVELKRSDDEIIFIIEDEGNGFDWMPYLEFDPARAYDPNGRGIYMAKTMSFDSLEYLGNGNKLIARVYLK